MRLTLLLCTLALACAATASQADTLVLPASADSTVYQGAEDSSNGAGDYLFTSVTNNNLFFRTVLRFDLSSIPPGSQIQSVSLQLYLSRFGGSTATVGIHRLGESWSEGSTNSEGQEGLPDPATQGDVTWSHRSWNTQQWSTFGGVFTPTASATLSVANSTGIKTWASTPALVADVQSWVNDPVSNFGWLLKVESEAGRRSKRWNSRTNPTSPPQLTITFVALPLFADGFESGDTSGWSLTSP